MHITNMDFYSTYVDKTSRKNRTNFLKLIVNYPAVNTRRMWATVLLLLSVQPLFASQDTTRVYFRLDKPQPDKQAISRLDSLLYADVLNSKDEYLLVGYADHLGTNIHNDSLSLNRAQHVKAYLVSMGIPQGHISLCIGKGEVPRDVELPEGYAADRRVDIVRLQAKTEQPKQRNTVPRSDITIPRKDSLPEMTTSEKAVRFNTTTPVSRDQFVPGALFVLDRIYFYTGRHKVVEESQPEMEKLYHVLADNPGLVIRIEGHVCCVPPITDALDEDTREVALSRNRAKVIYDYLVRKGIDPDRLSYTGFGKTRPLRKREFTQEDQDMNKRVEIRILKN